ncbi:phage minor head protein [Acinetobacter sp. V102_4]|uniref:phage head morphogenesis protein n=1 Tax=Acinetobacter sp. V102_4 TaxID=3072984 RepID=UPI00287C57C8|nr:phage minor head protein [Acinetobacter sp. V102_4]MDS7929617.1 phage minor head protein [Acinetobacter sp. V102_4]
MDKPTMQALFKQPPRKAIEYLEQKQLMPSQDWWQVQGNAHNKAFVIAQMTRMDLLEEIRQSLLDAQKNGWDLKKWSEVVEPKMRQRGWWGKQDILTEDGQRTVQLGNPYRLKTIYQTNMAQAYEAGRQAVIWDDNPLFPYVQYSAILDNRTRPSHQALHGVVMHKNDPAWQYIAPKNGYNCRCTVIELMEGDVQGQKLKVWDSGEFLQVYDVDVSHGGVAQVARLDLPDRPSFSTDAGWVGRPASLPTKQLMDKTAWIEPRLASNSVTRTFENKAVVNQYNEEVKQWIQNVDPKRPKNEMRHVGVLDHEFLDALSKQNIDISSAALVVHDKYTLGHLDKDRKKHDRGWVENIVAHLTEPHDLYLDTKDNTPLLVFDIDQDGEVYKLVLHINKSLNAKDQTGDKQKVIGNLIRTVVIDKQVNFTNGQQYKFLARKK